MPEMFVFDDFEKCMALSSEENSPNYCIVNSQIKPDNASSLYKVIDEFSQKEKQHFRHDKIQRGVCVKDCLNLAQNLRDEAENLFTEKFPMNSKLTLDFIKYQNLKQDRSKLDHVLNICVNDQLKTNYNLTSYSTIEYCLMHDPQPVPTGFSFH